MSTIAVRSSEFIVAGDVNVSGDAWESELEFTVEVHGGISGDDMHSAGARAILNKNGASSLALDGSSAIASAPPDRITGRLFEDAWESSAEFVAQVNGKAVTTPRSETPTTDCQFKAKLHLHD